MNASTNSKTNVTEVQKRVDSYGKLSNLQVDAPEGFNGIVKNDPIFFFFYGRIPHTLETRGDKLLQLRNGTHIRAKKRPLRHMCTLMDETYSL